MDTIEIQATSIGLFSINTYGTNLDSAELGLNQLNEDAETIESQLTEKGIEFEPFNAYDHSYNNKAHIKALAEHAFNHVSGALKVVTARLPFVKSFSLGESYSPREYNFTGDNYDINFEVEDLVANLQTWIDSHKYEELQAHLQEKFSSYDGFISFMPNSVESLMEETNLDYILTAILSFEIHKSVLNEEIDLTECANDFFEYLLGNYDSADHLEEVALNKFNELRELAEQNGISL